MALAPKVQPFAAQPSASEKIARPFPRYETLDLWRGVAAISVCAFHAVSETFRTGHSPLLTVFSLVASFGYLGVTLFFVISGFCIAESATRLAKGPSPARQFFLARALRIFPPYLLSSLAIVALSAVAALAAKSNAITLSQSASLDFFDQSATFYFATLTLTQELFGAKYVNSVYWSLSFEVAFYALVWGLIWLGQLSGRSSQVAQWIARITWANALWLILAPSTCLFPFVRFPHFGLGAALWLALRASTPRARAEFFGCVVLVFAATLRYAYAVERENLSHWWPVAITVLCFSFMLYALHRWDSRIVSWKIARVLTWIGGFSYTLFLLHSPFIGIFNQLRKRLSLTDGETALYLSLEIVATIGLARLAFALVEAPFLRSRDRGAGKN